ncbi:hypothetical protein [Emcibacter nanhaiensis]|uniref:Uncharacterized protein n=1 Tax=Emcibacter nanhaiensis TaxID=1505037 RepID=A0A501PHF5_9PROT|nr:hypothetical protein [Emcibacter nanhaiensis]TPD59900.1 hypothetical protein FIV46_10495 [Emcibacter nanhaiensis]
MQIIVSDSGVILEEADRFDGFKIVSGLEIEEVEGKLAGSVGYADGQDNFFIRREWIVSQAPAAGQAGWQQNFEKMINYAASHGWVDSETGAIRAHVERPEA